MSVGIACLLADEPAEAARLALMLDKLNEERREIEQRMQLEAIDIAAGVRFGGDGGEALGLCLFDESWHQGVVGLVAGRIKDRWNRPVIAFARAEDGSLRGSARSIPGVNIRDALDSIATLPSGPHRQIRRPRHGGRLEHARGKPGGVPDRLRRRNRRAHRP